MKTEKSQSFTGDKDLDEFIFGKPQIDDKKAERMVRSEKARQRREELRGIEDRRVRKEG